MEKKVLNFNVLLTEEAEGGYSVSVPNLPGCFSQGETLEEALAHIKEAIELHLEEDEVLEDYEEPQREFIVPVSVHA